MVDAWLVTHLIRSDLYTTLLLVLGAYSVDSCMGYPVFYTVSVTQDVFCRLDSLLGRSTGPMKQSYS